MSTAPGKYAHACMQAAGISKEVDGAVVPTAPDLLIAGLLDIFHNTQHVRYCVIIACPAERTNPNTHW